MPLKVLLSLPLLAPVPSAAETFSPAEVEAAAADPKAFTLDPATVEIIPLTRTPLPQGPGIPQAPAPLPGDPLVFLDRIVNLGLKLWKVVEDNRPVVDVRTQYANALPQGVPDWSSLSGWERPEATVYALRAKNLYGVTVVNLRYMVQRTRGGSYGGKGRYLHAVSAVPLRVEAAWGYRVTLSAEAPSVANVGTSEDPVAGMVLNVGWAVDTVLKSGRGTAVYYLQGDGLYREIGGPFRRNAAARGALEAASAAKL